MDGDQAANVDFRALRRDFVNAKSRDDRYSRENDAKFRAINQKVATYEEFKEIVQASHLQPLAKGDKMPSRFQQPWNTVCSATEHRSSASPSHGGDSGSSEAALGRSARGDGADGSDQALRSVDWPKTAAAFQQTWRRSKAEERYRLLLYSTISVFKDVCRGDLSPDILEPLIHTVHEYLCSAEDIPHILQIFELASHSKRFDLNVQFFSAAHKTKAGEIFHRLLSMLRDGSANESTSQSATRDIPADADAVPPAHFESSNAALPDRSPGTSLHDNVHRIAKKYSIHLEAE